MCNTFAFQVIGPNGYNVPVVIFDNTLSRAVAKDIVEGKSYPIVPFVKNVSTVVDIGANVGLSALWFSRNYPQSRVVAVEPSPVAFALLAQNVRDWPKIQVHNVGLHAARRSASLFLGSMDAVTNSVGRSVFNSQESVPVVLEDSDAFLTAEDIAVIDILKLDTEGCERPILDRIRSWIPNIKVIYIEYHSEADRLWVDNLMAPTHVLCWGRVQHAHRGEFCYVARSAYPSLEEADKFEIKT
jgi:FkbM family methyltransferase